MYHLKKLINDFYFFNRETQERKSRISFFNCKREEIGIYHDFFYN